MESSMKHEIFELFEKFPDGSSRWRDSVPGFEITCLRLQKLAQQSENQHYAINLATGEILTSNFKRKVHGFRATSKFERRSKIQAA
jgi:hypothetical protein